MIDAALFLYPVPVEHPTKAAKRIRRIVILMIGFITCIVKRTPKNP